jgi:glutamine synthetase
VARSSTSRAVSHFDEDKFSGPRLRRLVDRRLEGHRSLRHAADARPEHANIDPFFEETTLILTCDVIEPGDGKAYDRDPRSIAKRAEAYLKASGMGDTAYFGPEPEFFIFDGVRWSTDVRHTFYEDRRVRSPLEHRRKARRRQHGPPSRPSRAATSPCRRSTARRHARRDVPDPRILGIPVEVHHHEVAGAGQNEIGTKFSTLVERADWTRCRST